MHSGTLEEMDYSPAGTLEEVIRCLSDAINARIGHPSVRFKIVTTLYVSYHVDKDIGEEQK
jgi:hypothetical protein